MNSEIKTELAIVGESLDFDDLTAFVGLDATETWVRSHNMNTDIIPKFAWSIGADYTECVSVDYKFVELFSLIAGHEERIIEYSTRNSLKVLAVCNIRIYEDRPLYELSMTTIRKLANLNAEFLMDIFDFSAPKPLEDHADDESN